MSENAKKTVFQKKGFDGKKCVKNACVHFVLKGKRNEARQSESEV